MLLNAFDSSVCMDCGERCAAWLQVFSSTEEIDTILKCLPTSDEMIKLQPYLQGACLCACAVMLNLCFTDLDRVSVKVA
jgi:hypothetical protein